MAQGGQVIRTNETSLQQLPDLRKYLDAVSSTRRDLVSRGRRDALSVTAHPTKVVQLSFDLSSSDHPNGLRRTDDERSAEYWLKKGVELELSGKYEDYQEVIDCYVRGLELDPDHAELHWKLGWALSGRSQNWKYELSWPEFVRAAELGYVEAQCYLGMCYRDGIQYKGGVAIPQDSERAVKWLNTALKQREPAAAAILGYMYYNGKCVEHDVIKAFSLLATAVRTFDNRGWKWVYPNHLAYSKIAYLVATMYFEGDGTSKDIRQALFWCRKAIASMTDEELKETYLELEKRILDQLGKWPIQA